MAVNILLVEDEPAIQQMVAMSLGKAGYDVALAGDTVEAQSHIAGQLPDLILLDWMLPGTSGVEYARQLKKHELTREIPIGVRNLIKSGDSTAAPTTTSPSPFRRVSWWRVSTRCCAAPRRT